MISTPRFSFSLVIDKQTAIWYSKSVAVGELSHSTFVDATWYKNDLIVIIPRDSIEGMTYNKIKSGI